LHKLPLSLSVLFILIYLLWHWNLHIPAPGKGGILLGIAAAVMAVLGEMGWLGFFSRTRAGSRRRKCSARTLLLQALDGVRRYGIHFNGTLEWSLYVDADMEAYYLRLDRPLKN
jgi:hypothetical protein